MNWIDDLCKLRKRWRIGHEEEPTYDEVKGLANVLDTDIDLTPDDIKMLFRGIFDKLGDL